MLSRISNYIINLNNRDYFIFDLFILLLSPVMALFLRFEGKFAFIIDWSEIIILILIFLVIKLFIFYKFGFYNRIWRNASVDELARIVLGAFSVLLFEIFSIVLLKILGNKIAAQFPYSLPILDTIITFSFVAMIRFSSRFIEAMGYRIDNIEKNEGVIIAGAGQSGFMILTEILRSSKFGRVIGFVDDDIDKLGLKLKGIPVLGTISELDKIIVENNIKNVIIAMPSASGKKVKEIYDICKKLNINVLTVPSLQNIIEGKLSIRSIRNIKLEDLLRREQIRTNTDEVKFLIKNNIVLISGAGGSIGRELVRQILSFEPQKIVLLGHGENSIFEIEQEILNSNNLQKTEIISVIADIRNKKRIERVFLLYKPKIVYHAAAHKHVPLMESNVEEAITNNFLGTKNLVEIAVANSVDKFILISTDKAVNPTSIMGASKRMAEMVVLDTALRYNKEFSVVRFGNVLGSRGSVVELFKRQIEAGGPIKVTHPDIKRYFMTIPEAVQLVLLTSSLNKGGEVFVLDMGEPVKIIDLAKDMIRLYNLTLGEDIDIEITGLRPGEKLFEELFLETEQYERTKYPKIFIAKDSSRKFPKNFDILSERLLRLARRNNSDKGEIIKLIKEIVPEYNPLEN